MTSPALQSWKWQARAGRWVLVSDQTGQTILAGKDFAHLQAIGPDGGGLRLLEPSYPVAKLIAAAPDLRRHAEILINGIDIGLVEFTAVHAAIDAIADLRAALKKSEAS